MAERVKEDKIFVAYDKGSVLYDPKQAYRVRL